MLFILLLKNVTHIELKVWGKETKKAADIVLDVSKSFQGNVCSEILSKVVACQHGIWQLFRT